MHLDSLPAHKRSPQTRPRVTAKLLASITVLVLTTLVVSGMQAQTFTVIHTFNGQDGSFPAAGVSLDSRGNLYGTTVEGGPGGNGTVYKLAYRGSGWVLTQLYSFTGTADGAQPQGGVAMAADGTLYGTTNWGGGSGCQQYGGCGTVFHLNPPPSAPRSVLAPWIQTVIYTFNQSNGEEPEGNLVFDHSGNLYGTTVVGGGSNQNCDCGVLYQLVPSGQGWTGNTIHVFTGRTIQNAHDGAYPVGGLIADAFGNLYGVTTEGGLYGGGIIYEFSNSGSSWTEQTLAEFQASSGAVPMGGVILDSSGNLYGTTTVGGANGSGTVFEFEHGGFLRVLYNLPTVCNNSCGPQGTMAMDRTGNRYGTVTAGGIYANGTVFKLTPGTNGWTYTSLHDFTVQSGSDGAFPTGTLVIDENGNLYGTASEGGEHNQGTIWKITP